ncbi:DUF739 family protein [Anaerolactibacter massiliensis]|uniref:DUF739 family protein n=1 Tax=Anaerolactibacter massiliensis TaxID=2044573 RepID=UPI000CF915D9|nr:DUF739 family protein [Anaerolactibacter massiliensis]
MSELQEKDVNHNSLQFSYNALRGRIIEVCGRNKVFADKMGMSEASLSSKLSGKAGFSQEDIFKACQILDIPDNQINHYFFTLAV